MQINLLLGTLSVAVVLTGSWRDALFGLGIVANSLGGIVQEVRAKRALERLELLNAPLAHAGRDGEVSEFRAMRWLSTTYSKSGPEIRSWPTGSW